MKLFCHICIYYILSVNFPFVFIFQVVTVYSFVGFKAPAYGDYEYPLWVLLIGWAVSLCPAMVIPICSIHTLVTENGTFMEVFHGSILFLKHTSVKTQNDILFTQIYNLWSMLQFVKCRSL